MILCSVPQLGRVWCLLDQVTAAFWRERCSRQAPGSVPPWAGVSPLGLLFVALGAVLTAGSPRGSENVPFLPDVLGCSQPPSTGPVCAGRWVFWWCLSGSMLTGPPPPLACPPSRWRVRSLIPVCVDAARCCFVHMAVALAPGPPGPCRGLAAFQTHPHRACRRRCLSPCPPPSLGVPAVPAGRKAETRSGPRASLLIWAFLEVKHCPQGGLGGLFSASFLRGLSHTGRSGSPASRALSGADNMVQFILQVLTNAWRFPKTSPAPRAWGHAGPLQPTGPPPGQPQMSVPDVTELESCPGRLGAGLFHSANAVGVCLGGRGPWYPVLLPCRGQSVLDRSSHVASGPCRCRLLLASGSLRGHCRERLAPGFSVCVVLASQGPVCSVVVHVPARDGHGTWFFHTLPSVCGVPVFCLSCSGRHRTKPHLGPSVPCPPPSRPAHP